MSDDPVKDAITVIGSEVDQLTTVTHAIERALTDDAREALAQNCAVLVAKSSRIQAKAADYIAGMERLDKVKNN